MMRICAAVTEQLPQLDSYLKVALIRVEDNRLLSVIDPLHLQCEPADGWLEVGLLSIHHQANAIGNCMLEFQNKSTHTQLATIKNKQNE